MQYLLADGRSIVRRQTPRSGVFKMKNGVISAKRCTRCKEWKDIGEFEIQHDDTLRSMCRGCIRLYWGDIENGADRREHGWNGREKLRDRIKIIDNVEKLQCTACNTEKTLDNFIVSHYKGHERKEKLEGYCQDCRRRCARFCYYLRRCRQRFGEDSPEFKTLKNAGWKGDFKVVSQMLGLSGHKPIRNYKSKNVLASMRLLSYRLNERHEGERQTSSKNSEGQGRNITV